MTTPLDAAALVAALALLFHWLVRRQLARLDDPGYLREHGIVVADEGALESRTEPIGTYRGQRIWGSVTFCGMTYRFDHVSPRRDAGPRELYLEPGLVYLTD